MELWIRSQDRTKLVKVDLVFINEISTSCYNIETNSVRVGSYKTRERALEIFNEIQNLLLSSTPKNAFVVLKNVEFDSYETVKGYMKNAREDNFFVYFGDKDTSVDFIQPNVLVYEMPKE